VAGKRRIADLVLAKSSSLADLDTGQLRIALASAPTRCSPKTSPRARRGHAMSATRRRKPPARPTRGPRRPGARLLGHDTNQDRHPSRSPLRGPRDIDPVPRAAHCPAGRPWPEHYFAATYQKAASLAIALAAASDLLVTDDPDD